MSAHAGGEKSDQVAGWLLREKWLKVLLILVPVAAALLLLARVIAQIVPDPWEAVITRWKQVQNLWPLSFLPAEASWWWIVCGCVGIAAAYICLRLVEAHLLRKRPFDGKFGEDPAVMPPKLDAAAALLFMKAVVDPQQVFSRITESVQPYTRSLKVRTTLSVRVSRAARGQLTVVPIIMSSRGRLENSLSFTNPSGMRVSSLNRTWTNAHIHGVVRALIRTAGPAAWLAFHTPRLGSISLDERIGDFITQTSAAKNEPASQILTNRLMERILSLPTPRKRRLLEISGFINALRLDYPICVRFTESDFSAGDARITVERRVIPAVIGKSGKGIDARWTTSKDSLSGRGQRSNWIDRQLASAVAFLRQLAGVTSSVLVHQLENADRAQSYHLEVRGPEGHYAARQALVDEIGIPIRSAETLAKLLEHAPLRGQRHTHLYLRRANIGIASFQAHFNERTPGSMAIALAAAASTLAIAIILGTTQIFDANRSCAARFPKDVAHCLAIEPANVADNGSLIQILLTFPIALLAVSFARSSSVWGGLLVARVTNVCVIVLSLLALALSSLTSLFSTTGLSVAWIVLLGLLTLVFAGAFVSWFQRTLVHISYIRSRA